MRQVSIGQGHVFHSRKETAAHSFKYPTFFLHFKCSDEAALQIILQKKFSGLLSMVSSDYLAGQTGSFNRNVKDFIKERCDFDAQDVWLHTLPRMFGYAFNPVSFWFCRRGEKLEAVLVEVNNTFGERHFYWVQNENGISNDQWVVAQKVFHVSPFFPVEGHYKFRFQISEEQMRVDINYHAADGTLKLATWVSGQLSPLVEESFVNLISKYGWMTPLVVLRIHFQAFKLWQKKIRFHRKPTPPQKEVSS